ncbi:MAG: Holliday junction branch migration protein RuvA [Rhodospirillales bacterium]|nr:Holliday junction branch migration protein RuvA [Rhodospirillales bacterium]
MIAKITGRVDTVADGSAVIDVGGIGYLVFCSARTLRRLAEGTEAALLIDTHVREDGINLYGFVDSLERAWFRLLITVQGVGPKAALAILSVAAPADLAFAIAAGDRAVLTQASGIGARLAQRIATELKDKAAAMTLPAGMGSLVGAVSIAATTDGAGSVGAAADAVSALVNLGFRPVEAHTAVATAAGRLGEGAALDALIRAGLADLAKREPGP